LSAALMLRAALLNAAIGRFSSASPSIHWRRHVLAFLESGVPRVRLWIRVD